MGCRTLFLNGHAVGIACDRTRYQKCSSCSKYGARIQCDYPVKTKSGTCDRWLCHKCAVKIGPDRDYCPPHHRMTKEAETQ